VSPPAIARIGYKWRDTMRFAGPIGGHSLSGEPNQVQLIGCRNNIDAVHTAVYTGAPPTNTPRLSNSSQNVDEVHPSVRSDEFADAVAQQNPSARL